MSFFQFTGSIKNLAIAGLSCPPIYLTRKGAELVRWGSSHLQKTDTLNHLGKYGQEIAETLFLTANRVQVIFYTHRLDNVSDLFSNDPSVLCKTRNVVKKEVIWFNEDVKKYQEFLKKYIEQNPKESTEDELVEMSRCTLRGANTDGICQGASLVVIRELQKNPIETEEQLIQFIKPWEEGFPAEAAALQNNYPMWGDVHSKRDIEKGKIALDSFSKFPNGSVVRN